MTIEHTPIGSNGSVKLVVRLGNNILAAEKVDLLKPKARDEFIDRLCGDRLGIDRGSIKAELTAIAAGLADNGEPSESTAGQDEIDATQIVRPEIFIHPAVTGLAVPTVHDVGGKVAGSYALYVRWSDGRRECVDMADALELPDDGRLWMHPSPGNPTPHEARRLCGWSAEARRHWLDGGGGGDPAGLFQRIAGRIAYFIDLPAEHAPGATAILALWVMLAYIYPVFDAVPYLYISGPAGSGKSRVFDVLARLVYRPLTSSNLTGPALFRTLHQQGGTLLFDEAERLKQTNDPAVGEISSMLLAGYKRGGQATRLEQVGDSFHTVAFDVFGPKALACIVGLPPALMSRCIRIAMFRAGADSPKPRRRIDADRETWQALRDDLHALTLNHGSDWLTLAGRSDVCPHMSGRDFELWHPLLTLAAWFEDHGAIGLLKLVQDHALRTIDDSIEDQTPEVDEVLLKVLADEIRIGHTPQAKDVLSKAKDLEPVTFAKWSAKGVASHLKRYGLVTKKSHGKWLYNRVTLDDLHRVAEAYSMDLGFDDDDAIAPL